MSGVRRAGAGTVLPAGHGSAVGGAAGGAAGGGDVHPEPPSPGGRHRAVSRGAGRSAARASGVAGPAVAVSAAALGAALTNLVVAVITARALDVGGRGELVLILTVTGLTGMFVALGTGTSARYYLGRTDPRVSVDHVLGLSLLLLVPQCLVTAAIVGPTLWLADAPERGPGILVLTGLLSVSTLLGIQLIDTLNAVGKVIASALVNTAGCLAQLAALVVLQVSTGTLRVAPVLAVSVVAGAFQCVAGFVLLRRAGLVTRPQLDRAASALLIRTGVPALGMNTAMSMTFRLDRYLIGVMSGTSAVGIYSVAATASEILRLVPSSWGQVLCYRVASGTMGTRAVFAELVRVFAVMAGVAALMWLAADHLVLFFFGDAYRSAVTPLRVLLVAELLLVAFQIDARVLSGQGRTKACGAAGLVGLAVVAAADVILIPAAGMVGAAWASLIAYGVVSLWTRAAMARVPRVPRVPREPHVSREPPDPREPRGTGDEPMSLAPTEPEPAGTT
ncbi:lipopolysaccharide biosynthesis protein [Frankia sp. R43]|uniref:lipopolysaccharide biosynthesis protein n=1 Tax=Frankia sp. R43 TaxID=269536 RepID=UPI0006C9EFAD|nr:polysaccharide biosynthesis C-terminal domain-containing protein [Frankia sp. R43]